MGAGIAVMALLACSNGGVGTIIAVAVLVQ